MSNPIIGFFVHLFGLITAIFTMANTSFKWVPNEQAIVLMVFGLLGSITWSIRYGTR